MSDMLQFKKRFSIHNVWFFRICVKPIQNIRWINYTDSLAICNRACWSNGKVVITCSTLGRSELQSLHSNQYDGSYYF